MNNNNFYFSDFINAGLKGHANFDFLDVSLSKDNQIFIDPVLLGLSTDNWSQNAQKILQSYFDNLFIAFKNDTEHSILCHGNEPNATKLGYGKKPNNGKGKTAKGLYEALHKLKYLLKDIPTINQSTDIPILIDGFAEDCMSDLLTNILHQQLYEFTAEQMKLWNIPSNFKTSFWTWDISTSSWKFITRDSWSYQGKEILMIPKWIVRKNYLFRTHQYLYSVIADRIRNENNQSDIPKIDIINNISRKKGSHWEYQEVTRYTIKNPDTLTLYHKLIPYFYNRAHGTMSDNELDVAIYGNLIEDIA